MKLYGIVGAGGFGREVIPLAHTMLQHEKDYQLVFVDESPPKLSTINGFNIISLEDFLNINAEQKYFNIAIASYLHRQRLAALLMQHHLQPFSIVAKNSMDLSHNEIAMGAILCPFTIITANAKIGKFFHANIYSYVAHDCVIGDYVTFAPSVHCNGNVVVKDYAYIGTGALIKQGTADCPIIIGEGAIVGMGAVVTKSVPPFTTVVGNPAKPLLSQLKVSN